MDVANVKEPFEVIVRLSVALFCNTRPVLPLTKPVTTPLMVNGPDAGPPPSPGPEPEPVPVTLQPARSVAIINKVTQNKGLMNGFMVIGSSFAASLISGQIAPRCLARFGSVRMNPDRASKTT